MLTVRRLGVIVGVAALSLVAFSTPAFAGDYWGTADCGQEPTPACELGAGTSGDSAAPSQPKEQPGPNSVAPKRTGRAGAPAPRKPDTVYDDPNSSTCSYTKTDFTPPPGGVISIAYRRPLTSSGVQQAVLVHTAEFRTAAFRPAASSAQVQPPGQGPGSWYVWTCNGKDGANAVYRPPVFIPDGQQPAAGPAQPSPAELAQRARKQLQLPDPAIVVNPAGDQLVNLPTWMWLSGGWAPVRATAAVPGVAVTATATPTSVVWSMGDGTTETCTGPGTPYPPGADPTAASPDCGHTYRQSSAGQPGQEFPVTATIHWTVAWAGAGQGGEFPDLTTTGTVGFRVAEAQALNGGG